VSTIFSAPGVHVCKGEKDVLARIAIWLLPEGFSLKVRLPLPEVDLIRILIRISNKKSLDREGSRGYKLSKGFLSMKKFLRIKLISVFVASALIIGASGQGLWSNTVFCISGEGHAAFEPVHSGSHPLRPGEFEDNPSIYELSSGPGDNPCSDIPVFTYGSYQRRSFEGNPIPGNPSPLSSAQGKISDVCIHSIHSPKKTTNFLSSTLLSLRTTVLLI
jgi:hypothetical protein